MVLCVIDSAGNSKDTRRPMSIALRPYQSQLVAEIAQAWAEGARNVLAVSPTGSGKTVLLSALLQQHRGAACVIAHRQELVSQISLALARNNIRHSLMAGASTVANIVGIHMSELGRSWYDPSAVVRVAGVDTLVRAPASDPWMRQVSLWVCDEAHHLCRDTKWGRAIAMLPNARGLGVTATPVRTDGKGLGRHADGVIDAMVRGPSMRDLIGAGYLTDYRIFAPRSDLDLRDVPTGASGDYSPAPLRQAVRRSRITGDVVQHYKRIAAGKLGVTFAVDVETAIEICDEYRAAGVPAEVVSAKTPDSLRIAILRRFKARQVLQLVNVDLFGEGFDLPAIEVVSMARPTMSYGLFVQQFGRALRPMDGKRHALIIDHVGNTIRHGLPDAPREWSLDRRERRASSKSDAIPLRACPQCTQVYERVHRACPYCAHAPEPAGRSGPEQVDGDLCELSPEALARLRGDVAAVDGAPRIPQGAGPEVVGAIRKRHRERQEAQAALRETMALWGGVRRDAGEDERTAQRRFWLRYGVDVLGAQALGAREAEALRGRICNDLE